MKYPWQSETWEHLVRMLDRLPHALLLHGPEGTGKLALAEHFTQMLLCEGAARGADPCGTCNACRWFLAGNHPDVRLVEPEAFVRPGRGEAGDEGAAPKTGKPSTEIRIDQVRDLASFLNMGSHRGARRVALVQPAEDMNAHAANALLKGLEEPPPGALFVLVSHCPARLLPTIRSRCVAVPLPLPARDTALGWLAAQEADDGPRWLAFAGGAPLRALEYARDGTGIVRVLEALRCGDIDALRACGDHEEPAVIAETLQKAALDQAFAALAGGSKYATGAAPSGAAARWLSFARAMGRHRELVRHPLNPRLFAAEMVAGYAAASEE